MGNEIMDTFVNIHGEIIDLAKDKRYVVKLVMFEASDAVRKGAGLVEESTLVPVAVGHTMFEGVTDIPSFTDINWSSVVGLPFGEFAGFSKDEGEGENG